MENCDAFNSENYDEKWKRTAFIEIESFNINDFTVIFDQFNASFLSENKSVNYLNFWMLVYVWSHDGWKEIQTLEATTRERFPTGQTTISQSELRSAGMSTNHSDSISWKTEI